MTTSVKGSAARLTRAARYACNETNKAGFDMLEAEPRANRHWGYSMTPQGKKIWNSPQGAHLMDAMMGEEPFNEQDERTKDQLIQTSLDGLKRKQQREQSQEPKK